MYLYALAISENKRAPLIFSHWQHTISQSLRHVAAPRVLCVEKYLRFSAFTWTFK